MNDLKFPFCQLLKHPGFTVHPPQSRLPVRVQSMHCCPRKLGRARQCCYGGRAVAVLARPPRLLPTEDAADLSIIKAHLNDEVSATASNVVARSITYPPAKLARAAMLPCGDQALFEHDAPPACAFVGHGHRSRERYSQLVFQNCFVQCVRHSTCGSGLRQCFLRLAQFNHTARWRHTIKERGGNYKLADIMRRLQIRVVAHRTFVRFARFLQVNRTRIGVGVERGNDLQSVHIAIRMERDINCVAGPPWPWNYSQCSYRILNIESSILLANRLSRLLLAPG